MSGSLLQAMLAEDNLYAAWQKVRDNDGAPGVDGISIASFGEKLLGRLITLKSDIELQRYAPQPLLEVLVPKDNGKLRRLAIPAVRDRILQAACARIVTPLLDPGFEDASFGYRPGRSVKQAVARVAHYRDQGYQWVVDADISTFFDTIDHSRLLQQLHDTLPDASLLPLIRLWLAAIINPAEGQPYLLEKGIPQGSPLSPVLANLYLDHLDEAMQDASLRLVRFADDFLVLCRQREDAEDALELTSEVLDALQLQLNPDKTRIVHFEQGFRFLGVHFIRNLLLPEDPEAAPWLIPDAATQAGRSPAGMQPQAIALRPAVGPAADDASEAGAVMPVDATSAEAWQLDEGAGIEPAQRTLYVFEQGLRIGKQAGRLVLSRQRQELLTIPLGKLDHLYIAGNAMVSSALLRHAAEEGLQVHFAEISGRYCSSLDHGRDHCELHIAQQRAADDNAMQLMLARAFVRGKLQNCRSLLRRINRYADAPNVAIRDGLMAGMQAKLNQAGDIAVIRGLEGQGARLYFQALRELLGPEWQFDSRQRRPPVDPVNTLLSFGYAVLFHTVLAHIRRRGLSPWLGALHSRKAGHPALASDLMEEFRAPLIDQIVLQALRQKQISPADFSVSPHEAQPCRLLPAARKQFIALIEARLNSRQKHPRTGHLSDWQRIIQFQVYHYTRVLTGDEPVYHPLIWR